MIDIVALLNILPIFTLGLISPGPDFMVVSSVSLVRGRIDGMKSAAGIAVGMSVYALISLMGLSVFLTRYQWVAVLIKLCGGLYLLYLGFAMWKASLKIRHADEPVSADAKKKNVFLMGVLTNLTNPKVIAFFASIFALVLTPETNLTTKTAILVALFLECFLWFSFVAFCLSKDDVRTRYQRWQRVIDRTVGTVIGFFGLKLLFSARG